MPNLGDFTQKPIETLTSLSPHPGKVALETQLVTQKLDCHY